MKKFNLLLSAFLIGSSIFVGCTKDEVTSPTLSSEAKTAAQVGQVSDQTIVDLQTMADQATGTNLKSGSADDSSLLPVGAVVEVSTDTMSIKINFGVVGVTCGDGRIRKGLIAITRVKGSSIVTYRTEGYEVNGYKINLTQTVTFVKTGVDNTYKYGYLEFAVAINNGLIVTPTSDSVKITVAHTRKLILSSVPRVAVGWAVSGTSTIVFNGQAGGGKVNLQDIRRTVRDVVKPIKFPHFISGEIVGTLSTGKVVMVDFGNGDIFDSSTWQSKRTISCDLATETSEQD